MREILSGIDGSSVTTRRALRLRFTDTTCKTLCVEGKWIIEPREAPSNRITRACDNELFMNFFFQELFLLSRLPEVKSAYSTVRNEAVCPGNHKSTPPAVFSLHTARSDCIWFMTVNIAL